MPNARRVPPLRTPTRASLRAVLTAAFPHTVDLDAFLGDELPEVAHELDDGMRTTAKVNLILEQDPSFVLQCLKEWHHELHRDFAPFEPLLRFDPETQETRDPVEWISNADSSTTGALDPWAILPFTYTEAEIRRLIDKHIREQPEAAWKLEPQQVELTRRFVPSWQLHARAIARYQAQRLVVLAEEKIGDSTELVEREVLVPVEGSAQKEYSDLLVSGAPSFGSQHLSDLAPWDLKALEQPSTETVLPANDVRPDAAWEAGRSLVENAMRARSAELSGTTIDRVSLTDLRFEQGHLRLVALPIWEGTYQHDRKKFKILVNGHSGAVQVEYPRRSISWLGLLGIAILIACAIATINC